MLDLGRPEGLRTRPWGSRGDERRPRKHLFSDTVSARNVTSHIRRTFDLQEVAIRGFHSGSRLLRLGLAVRCVFTVLTFFLYFLCLSCRGASNVS